MVKGFEKHQERLRAIESYGKELARRAARRCELCKENNEPRAWDSAKDEEPSLETLILLCIRCRNFADGKTPDERTLRFLEEAVWNEHPHVAGLAKSLLARVDTDWARRVMDMLT